MSMNKSKGRRFLEYAAIAWAILLLLVVGGCLIQLAIDAPFIKLVYK